MKYMFGRLNLVITKLTRLILLCIAGQIMLLLQAT